MAAGRGVSCRGAGCAWPGEGRSCRLRWSSGLQLLPLLCNPPHHLSSSACWVQARSPLELCLVRSSIEAGAGRGLTACAGGLRGTQVR